jgi:hypothetical protein
LRGKAAGEDAAARKTSEQAAEIAAQRDVTEGKAGVQRQLEVKQFIENISAIERLSTGAGKAVAFAKLLEQNPEVIEQVGVIEDMVARLKFEKGTLLLSSPSDYILAESPTQTQSDSSGTSKVVYAIPTGEELEGSLSAELTSNDPPSKPRRKSKKKKSDEPPAEGE